MKKINTITLIILFLCMNLFASDIATITAIKGSAMIERGDVNIVASLGAELEEKDIIQTKENSKIQIIFKDETVIYIGKNSRFSIEEYLFDGEEKSVAKFGMIKGAMRAITGKIGKVAPQKFTVKAKTSTIGIRGTNFVVILNDDNFYQAYCTYGAISVTITNKTYIVKKGFYITLFADGTVLVKKYSKKDLKDMGEINFEIKGNQKKLHPLDSKLDNSSLDINFDEDSDFLIKEVSDTLSDVDKTLVKEDKVEQTTPNQQTPTNNSVGSYP